MLLFQFLSRLDFFYHHAVDEGPFLFIAIEYVVRQSPMVDKCVITDSGIDFRIVLKYVLCLVN